MLYEVITPFDTVQFDAEFKLVKKEINPFDFSLPVNIDDDYNTLESLLFKIEHESYLSKTELTTISKKYQGIFQIDKSKSIAENIIRITSYNVCYTKLLRALKTIFEFKTIFFKLILFTYSEIL